MLSGTCPRFPVAFHQRWTWVGTCRTPALFLYRSLPAFNRGRRVPSPAGAACRSGRPALPCRDPSWLLQLQRGFHPPPSSPRDHSLREAERERRRRELLGEGTMTNGAARGTGPVVSSSTLQRAHPVSSTKRPSPGGSDLPARAPNSPVITSSCPSPTPLPSRQAEPTLTPQVSVSFHRATPPLLPSPLTVGDWARPSWLLRCRPPPPPLLHAPAPQSPPPPPSGLAGSRSCACAAWSAGAFAGRPRLRSALRGRLTQCLMP